MDFAIQVDSDKFSEKIAVCPIAIIVAKTQLSFGHMATKIAVSVVLNSTATECTFESHFIFNNKRYEETAGIEKMKPKYIAVPL